MSMLETLVAGERGLFKPATLTPMQKMALRFVVVGLVYYGFALVEGMLMPPQAYDVTTISVLPFKSGGSSQAVAFRGPMLHRALNQFLTDVYWGDLDWLLLDLPPR